MAARFIAGMALVVALIALGVVLSRPIVVNVGQDQPAYSVPCDTGVNPGFVCSR